eukprot:753966-Hanusia_phi.AAC.2
MLLTDDGSSKQARERCCCLERRLMSRQSDENGDSIAFDKCEGILRFSMRSESLGKRRKNEEMKISLKKLDRKKEIQSIIKECLDVRLQELKRLDQSCIDAK